MQTPEAETVSKMELDVIAEQIYTRDGEHHEARLGFDEAGEIWEDYGGGIRKKKTLLEAVDSLRLMDGCTPSRNAPTFNQEARARFWRLVAAALHDGSPQKRDWDFQLELYRMQNLAFGFEVSLRKILFDQEQAAEESAGGFIIELLDICSDCARHMRIGYDDLAEKQKSSKLLDQVKLLNKLVRGLQMAADHMYGDGGGCGRYIDQGDEDFSDGFLLYQAEQMAKCAKRIDTLFHE